MNRHHCQVATAIHVQFLPTDTQTWQSDVGISPESWVQSQLFHAIFVVHEKANGQDSLSIFWFPLLIAVCYSHDQAAPSLDW
jgi:hypothetical protein